MTLTCAAKQSENEVEAEVVKWLRERGWLVRRKNVGLFYTKDGRPMPIGTPGECDWYAVHRHHGYVEIEAKATGRKPEKRQEEYMAKLRYLGIRAWWVDSISSLQAQYAEAFGSI